MKRFRSERAIKPCTISFARPVASSACRFPPFSSLSPSPRWQSRRYRRVILDRSGAGAALHDDSRHFPFITIITYAHRRAERAFNGIPAFTTARGNRIPEPAIHPAVNRWSTVRANARRDRPSRVCE